MVRLIFGLVFGIVLALNRLADLLTWLFARVPAGTQWRPVSGLERVWLAWNRIHPFVIHYVVEGQLDPEQPLDEGQLQQALDRVAESQPGLRLRLAGSWMWLHWVADGCKPRLRVVDDSSWDGHNPAGADFLDQPLDDVNGPVAEVVLVRGVKTWLVFRVLHAVTDGGGALEFVVQFFAALRGERLAPVAAGPLTDAEVGKKFCPKKRPAKEPKAPCLMALNDKPTGLSAWSRLHLDGQVPNTVASVAVGLASSALVPVNPALVRFAIPIDMRRMAKISKNSANLTGMLHLGLKRAIHKPDPVAAFQKEILHSIMRREFGWGPVSTHRVVRVLSLRVLGRITRRGLQASRRRDWRTTSAGLSHVSVKMAQFDCPGFVAETIFGVPPKFPDGELFVGVLQSDRGVEIVAHHPGGEQTQHQLQQLLANLADQLGHGGQVEAARRLTSNQH